jgi:hypothetical protein
MRVSPVLAAPHWFRHSLIMAICEHPYLLSPQFDSPSNTQIHTNTHTHIHTESERDTHI